MNEQIKNLQYSEDWFNYQRFYDEIASKKFNVLVELGTWKGHSISYLGKKLLEQSYDFKLYGVDLFDDSYIHTKEGNSHLASQMKYIYDVYNQNLIDAGVREVIKDIKGNKKTCFLKVKFKLFKINNPELPTSKNKINIAKSIKKEPTKVYT